MSELRRRIVNVFVGGDSPASTPSISRENSPSPDDYRVVPAQQYKSLTKKKGSKRRNFWIFGLGGLFGIVLAGFFASGNDMMDLAMLRDMNLDSILDVLPAGLIKDAQDLQVGTSLRQLPSVVGTDGQEAYFIMR